MGVLAEAAPVPADLFKQTDEAVEAANLAGTRPLADLYVNVYIQRVDVYRRELANALYISSTDVGSLTQSNYPTVSVEFTPELGSEPFTIDDDLYTGLFDVYTLYGWTGITLIELAVEAADPTATESRAGGVTASVWLPAGRFFRFGRNLLGLMIRD